MPDSVGQRIRDLRTRQQLSQADLAKQTQLSGSYVSLIESGRRPPTARALRLIAERLGCSIEYLEHGVGRPESAEDALVVELDFAELALRSGEVAEARTRFAEAAQRAAAHQQRPELAWRAHWGLARAHEVGGDLEAAVTAYEQLLRSPGGGDDDFPVETALCRAYLEAGDLSHAIEVGERALARAEADGETLVSDAAVELASTLVGGYHERGDLTRAHLLAQRVIEGADRARSPHARGAAYWNAGLVAEARGDLAAARRCLDRAVALYGEGDNARGVALLRVAQAWLVMQDGSPDVTTVVREWLDKARDELTVVGSTVDLAYVDTELARCALLEQDFDAAAAASQSALDRLGTGPRLETSRAQLTLARALLGLGAIDDAPRVLAQAAATLDSIGQNRQAAAVWQELADVYRELDRPAEAMEALQHGMAASGVPRHARPLPGGGRTPSGVITGSSEVGPR